MRDPFKNKKLNNRMGQDAGPCKGLKLRVRHFTKKKKRSAYLKVRCGCCPEKVEIHYGFDGLLEINGVLASVEEWRKILGPLLELGKK